MTHDSSRGLTALGVLLALGMCVAAYLLGMQTKQIGAGGPTKFEGTGLDAQAWNILQTADPSSREYATAYSIVSQPKTQLVQTENGMMPVEVPPQLPAWLQPPGGAGGPAAPPPGAVPAPTGAPAAAPVTPQGGAGAVIPGTQKPPTEQRVRNDQLYSVIKPEAEIVEKNFDALTDLANQAAGVLPVGSEYLTSPEYQRATNSLQTIVQSYLYSVSGATANPGEVAKLVKVLTPVAGEAKESISDKRARVKTMVEAVRRAAVGARPDDAAPDPAPEAPKKRLKFNPATGELE